VYVCVNKKLGRVSCAYVSLKRHKSYAQLTRPKKAQIISVYVVISVYVATYTERTCAF